MKTVTAKTAFRQVTSAAEKIRNGEPATIAEMTPGDTIRQGDVYLVCLDREPTTTGPAPSRQLAPGITQGSRHVAEGTCEVLTVDGASAIKILNRLIPATSEHEPFIGPMIRAPKGVEITHPEHGDRTLPPGSYLVVYQRSYAQQEIRRAQD